MLGDKPKLNNRGVHHVNELIKHANTNMDGCIGCYPTRRLCSSPSDICPQRLFRSDTDRLLSFGDPPIVRKDKFRIPPRVTYG